MTDLIDFITYRIFMVGFGGAIHCPFHLGFTDAGDNADPLYFDSVEDATQYVRSHINLQNHDYIIVPAVSK
jgi:hypothetical protein